VFGASWYRNSAPRTCNGDGVAVFVTGRVCSRLSFSVKRGTQMNQNGNASTHVRNTHTDFSWAVQLIPRTGYTLFRKRPARRAMVRQVARRAWGDIELADENELVQPEDSARGEKPGAELQPRKLSKVLIALSSFRRSGEFLSTFSRRA
jgi:hypothetical protein